MFSHICSSDSCNMFHSISYHITAGHELSPILFTYLSSFWHPAVNHFYNWFTVLSSYIIDTKLP